MNKKMTKDTPKVLSPDLEAPSASLRKEAYELAAAVWEMEPWVDFIEEQVLAKTNGKGVDRVIVAVNVGRIDIAAHFARYSKLFTMQLNSL